jgi:hypothetical protein
VLGIEVCSTHDFPLHYKGSSTLAQAATPLKYILEVPLSKIDRAADYYKVYCGFCLSRQISEQYLSWVMNTSFHILSTNYSPITDRGKMNLKILADLQVFSTTDYESVVFIYMYSDGKQLITRV